VLNVSDISVVYAHQDSARIGLITM
jgi:hypothetical protein